MASQSIVAEAREHLAAWRKLPFPLEIMPAKIWADLIAENHENIIQTLSPEALVERVTSDNITTGPAFVDEPRFKGIISGQLEWLKGFGRPLSSFPAYVQDSELASPRVITTEDGRRVSAAFLYHLGTVATLGAFVGKFETVLELGSGYGGMARLLKLVHPGVHITMCDLPETLYLCYIYLRRHFPNCTFAAMTERGTVPTADFVFVPAPLASSLAGSAFDVAVNTCSLSEMTQSACDYYLRIIENDIKVDYFHHLNRIGSPEPLLANACATSFGLDRHWDVLDFKWHDPGNYFNAYFPNYGYLLNLMLRRIPDKIRSPELYAGMTSRARSLLGAASPGSDEWHAAMLDIIRIERRSADIEAYLKVIRPLGWRETPYYESLLNGTKPTKQSAPASRGL
ncbi:MAG: putative sugar O-methyltransferase [Reyranella sp.]|nr:putative sugar O-methyltransferase [Reyranella sp.]